MVAVVVAVVVMVVVVVMLRSGQRSALRATTSPLPRGCWNCASFP